MNKKVYCSRCSDYHLDGLPCTDIPEFQCCICKEWWSCESENLLEIDDKTGETRKSVCPQAVCIGSLYRDQQSRIAALESELEDWKDGAEVEADEADSARQEVYALEKQVADMDKVGLAVSQVMIELEKERDEARVEIKDIDEVESEEIQAWRALWAYLNEKFPDAPRDQHSPQEIVDWAYRENERLRAMVDAAGEACLLVVRDVDGLSAGSLHISCYTRNKCKDVVDSVKVLDRARGENDK